MMSSEPDETLSIGPDQVRLYTNSTMVDNTPADRIFVQHYTGQEEEVLVFEFRGERKVTRIKLEMEISSLSPAVEAGARYKETLEDVSEEDRQRLLGLYDRLQRRTFK